MKIKFVSGGRRFGELTSRKGTEIWLEEARLKAN